MERLTDKRLAIPPGQWQEVTPEKAQELKEIPVPPMRELYYRLSQIEDILGDEYDLDRLRELAELDSAGCIPPCKIGDVFYRLWYGFDSAEVNEYRVSMITQKADKSWRIRATDTDSGFQIDLPFDECVKHAYKTREEAEAALAKLNSGT